MRLNSSLTPGLQAQCSLCSALNVRIIQRLSPARLVEAYRSELGLVVHLPTDELLYLICDDCDLRFFSPALTGDEAFYGQLQKISWYYNAAKQEFRMAAAFVNGTHDVLEIGAGRGLFCREIAPASYTGLEFSPTAIDLAAASGIRLLAQTIEEHALTNSERYDIVCTFQVLEHVSTPRTFLEAAIRCLRPGGLLIVSVPGEDSFQRFSINDILNMPPHHVTRWTDEALGSIARCFDVKLVAITPEPLGRNMRRLYAQAQAIQWLSRRKGIEPELLDDRLQGPLMRATAALATSAIRKYLSVSKKPRRGQAVLAVFRKPST